MASSSSSSSSSSYYYYYYCTRRRKNLRSLFGCLVLLYSIFLFWTASKSTRTPKVLLSPPNQQKGEEWVFSVPKSITTTTAKRKNEDPPLNRSSASKKKKKKRMTNTHYITMYQQQQQHKQTVVADDNVIDNTTLFRSDVDDVDGGGGFGACMLIMDDNHFLIEWLAYHYHVLPLKALILAVDPASKTSPRDITNRYSHSSSSSSSSNDKKRMYIEVWDHEDYLKPHLEEYTTSKKFTSNETSDHVKNVQTYIWRQRVFFLECMKRFHVLRGDDDDDNGKNVDNNKAPTRLSKNITHIAFVDSDEFITINPSAAKEFNVAEHLSLSTSSSTTTSAAATTTTPQKEEKQGATAIAKTPTVWDILQAAKRKQAANETSLSKLPFYQRLTGGCVPMARLQYSTKETSIRLQNASNSFNSSSFLTLRYQHHFGLQNLKKNRKIKSILDMTQLSPFHFKLEFIHAHRTLKSKCKVDWEWIQPLQSPIVVNHYVGSWDQWTFRDDPRSWTRKKVNKYQSMSGERDNNDNGGTTKVVFRQEMMAATTWLDEFVQAQGIETAQRLLEDVGYVPPRDTVLLHNDTDRSSEVMV